MLRGCKVMPSVADNRSSAKIKPRSPKCQSIAFITEERGTSGPHDNQNTEAVFMAVTRVLPGDARGLCCRALSVCLSACMSVCHVCVLCQNE